MPNLLALFLGPFLRPGRPSTDAVDLDELRQRWTTTPRPHRTWPGCQSRAQRRAGRAA